MDYCSEYRWRYFSPDPWIWKSLLWSRTTTYCTDGYKCMVSLIPRKKDKVKIERMQSALQLPLTFNIFSPKVVNWGPLNVIFVNFDGRYPFISLSKSVGVPIGTLSRSFRLSVVDMLGFPLLVLSADDDAEDDDEESSRRSLISGASIHSSLILWWCRSKSGILNWRRWE